MGDIGDVWNAAKDTATLFATSGSQAMPDRAFACPAGLQPGQLQWGDSQEETLEYAITTTNRAKEWFDLSTGSRMRIGCTWDFNGRHDEEEGTYLHDAYLWAVLDYSSAGTTWEVTGEFGDAVPHGETANLSGRIEVKMSFAGMHWFEKEFDIDIRGNGWGRLRPV